MGGISRMIFNVLKSTIEQEVIDANNQICANAGIPNFYATIWSNILKYQDYFYITAPNQEGWNIFTQMQLMQNVGLEISELEIPEEEV